MKKTLNFFQKFKVLLLVCLLAGPGLAIKSMAQTEYTIDWIGNDTWQVGTNTFAAWNDPLNWGGGLEIPWITDTNTADSQYTDLDAAGFNQDVGSIVICLVTNDTQVGQLYLGYNGGGGGILEITNGAAFQTGYDGEWTGVGYVAGPGTMILGPGSSFTCGSHLWIGQGVNSQGTVIDNGGTISLTGGQFGLSWSGAGGTNYAYFTNNAHLYLSQVAPSTLGYPGASITNVGILDIGAGSSVVISNNNFTTYSATLGGQSVNLLNCWETNHQLIAYEGAGTIQAIYNAAGNFTTLVGIPPVSTSTPKFNTEPTNVITSSGGTAIFSAQVSNGGIYQWEFNGLPVANGNGISGAQSSTLTIANVTAAEVGNYILNATNSSTPTAFASSTPASLNTQSFNLYPVITITGINTYQYEVQYTTSLTPPVTWTTLGTYTVGAGPLQVVDTATPLSMQRFYQVVQITP